MTTKAESAPGLVSKLSEILALVGRLEKKGFNRAQNYNFAREGDLVDMIRPLLATRRIFLHQSVVNHDRQFLYKTSSGNDFVLTVVTVEFTWLDGETGEKLEPQTFVGYGADSGDKGIYKALTGAEKYMLMKTFLVSTGDDPEADERVDQPARRQPSRQQAPVQRPAPAITPHAEEGVARGGRTSLASPAQLVELARLVGVLKWTRVMLVELIKDEATIVVPLIGEEEVDRKAVTDTLKSMPAELVGKLIAYLIAVEDAQNDATWDAHGDVEGGYGS